MNELKNERMSVERWKQAVSAGACQASYRRKRGYTETCDDYFVDGVQWADEHPADTKWLTLDTKPDDGDLILVQYERGRFNVQRFSDEDGFQPLLEFFCRDRDSKPEYQPVAWRPLADVVNEYTDYGAQVAASPSADNV